jgi:hypothetical protein
MFTDVAWLFMGTLTGAIVLEFAIRAWETARPP